MTDKERVWRWYHSVKLIYLLGSFPLFLLGLFLDRIWLTLPFWLIVSVDTLYAWFPKKRRRQVSNVV